MLLPDFENLIEEIRSRRRDLGWSQKKLASEAGVSQSLVAKLEQRMNVPNYESVRKIWVALEREESPEETAADLANPDIVSVAPDDTRRDAARIMAENDFSQLPVEEGGDFVGIVLSRDMGLVEEDVPVEEVMRRSVPIIPESASREAMAELLKTNNAVLVKGEEGIWGIVTPADLL